MGARDEPVMGDVLRARLAALVAEVRPPDVPTREGSEWAPEPGLPESGLPKRQASEGRVVEPAAPARAASEGGSGPTGHPAALASRVVEFGRSHLGVIGVIGLIGVIATIWAIVQARTEPVAVAAPTPVAATAAPSTTPTPMPAILRVHVLGAVRSPGVVRLEDGARVEDAITAAGGMAADARPGELNLAAPVADGAQVLVGSSRDPGGELRGSDAAGSAPGGSGSGGGASGAATAKINLNKATAEQLQTLPGVGPVTAQSIIAWRTQHQRFSRVEELQEVDGIGAKTYAKLAPLVTV